MIYLERKDRKQYLVDFGVSTPGNSTADSSAELKLLMESAWWGEYPHPVMVDASRALSQLRLSGDYSAPSVTLALHAARSSLMGTDGMRGLVNTDKQHDGMAGIRHYLQGQILTPALLSLSCQAFCSMITEALSAESWQPEYRIIVGNDGRDRPSGWQLLGSAVEGCRQAGFTVDDRGIIPTPYVPWLMLKTGCACGLMLTASHNPASQNGIKFFYKAKKLLPEGAVGDFALSAWMLALALDEAAGSDRAARTSTPHHGIDDRLVRQKLASSIATLAEMTIVSLPPDIGQVLSGEYFTVDCANGAFHWLAAAIMDRLELNWNSVDLEPDGSNINQHCGAAELEGARLLQLPETPNEASLASLPGIVRGLWESSRTRGARRCWGLSLDGDGDRGFLLAYQSGDRSVQVLDGDALGFILAGDRSESEKYQAPFVTLSVESDLMCARSMEDVLGIASRILGVGDKWIGHADNGDLLLGLESSGHLVLPVEVQDPAGRTCRLLTGNGLRSVLLAVYQLVRRKASPEFIANPYRRGFSQTRYAYFVDKHVFQNGSRLWQDSSDWMAGQTLPEGISARLEAKDDSGLLYWALYRAGKQVAALFARNSGTEDKHAVYLQCLPELEQLLTPLAERLWLRHRASMKLPSRIENRLGDSLLDCLEQIGRSTSEQVRAAVSLSQREIINPGDFDSAIHGLRKEGLVLASRDAWLELSAVAVMIRKRGLA